MPTQKTNSFSLFEREREKDNPMVATWASRLVNIRKKNIAASLSDFEGSSHKLERVKTINTIDFRLQGLDNRFHNGVRVGTGVSG